MSRQWQILGRHVVIGIMTGLITLVFGLLPIAEIIELKVYDLFHVFKRAVPADDILIVAIDEPSFAELNMQWPWPRSIHARLVDTLKREGASAIGLDIVFAEPSSPAEDRALSDAIMRAGNVVLASDIDVIKDSRYSRESVIEPTEVLRKAASTGIVTIPLDRDNVVRRFYHAKEGEALFSEQLARVHSQKAAVVPKNAYVAYAGPPRTVRTVSYYQALDTPGSLPRDFFRGKIVLVGKAVKTPPEPDKPAPDTFATPFISSGTSQLMYGVEIQANMVNNLLRGEFVKMAGPSVNIMLIFFTGLLSSLSQAGWRPIRSGLYAALCIAACLVAAYVSFAVFRTQLPALSLLVASSLPYGIFGAEAYARSEKKRKELKGVFSHYISPSILENILANPNKLKLGGERVEATVLFSDIADFTTMSEAMPPEDVSRLLNLYFSEMTSLVFENKGTIDKFMGDALMAFWGAPAADDDQALNACRTAVAMQKRLVSLREEFKAMNLPEIFVRIGINTGIVVAGNMGASELFVYTVLGDPVNLASRLEKTNKEFGTSIIIGSSVFEKVVDRVSVRHLGKVNIKGKTKHVEIYELLDVR